MTEDSSSNSNRSGDNLQFECSICGNRFVTEAELVQHIKEQGLVD